MGLQIEVTGPVITPAGEMYHDKLVNAEFTLNAWLEGVDKKTTEPVIKGRKFKCQQKTVIDDKPLDELPDSVTVTAEMEVTREMKTVVEAYEYAKEIEANPKITKMHSNIQGGLNG